MSAERPGTQGGPGWASQGLTPMLVWTVQTRRLVWGEAGKGVWRPPAAPGDALGPEGLR